ncbi:ABC-type branched-subunit amino acid transport system permease subunit [Arthrobacter sp. CAN_A214]|uniref:hypothetical protein n=1 Tax=Arthrobacter sp. CAN_A214 TaxID=2787720 RepID=UPI0018CAD094
MDELIGYGALIAGSWGLSVYALKKVRDSDHAEPPLKDSAAVAIIAISFLGACAAAFLLGANSLGTKGDGFLAVLLFLLPFFVMMVTYWGKLKEGPEGETTAAKTKRLKDRGTIIWLGPLLFIAAVVLLAVLPALGFFGSFNEFPTTT